MTVSTAALASLVVFSCADRRGVWSISDAAIDKLTLEEMPLVQTGRFEDSSRQGCQAVMTLRLPEELPARRTAAHIRSAFEQATDVGLDCIGSCGNGENCKVHHTIDYPDPQAAETGCICMPRTPPPCRLRVIWVAGQETRRLIEEVACGQVEEAAACVLSIFHTDHRLEIGCSIR